MTSKWGDDSSWMVTIIAAGTAIGVASGFVAVEVVAAEAPESRRWTLFFTNVSYWSAWAVLAVAVIRLSWRLPLTGRRRWLALAAHIVMGVIFAGLHLAALLLLTVLIRWTLLGVAPDFSGWLMDMRWLTRGQIEWEITMYWAIVGLAHAMAFRAEGRARALQAARLDAELSQARLQALQQQMHPHFLFNTLQSIAVLMHRDPDAAEQMIEDLGQLLRGSLRSPGATLVPLTRELEYVGHYLAIEQRNFGERLTVERDVAANTLSCLVPELVLQPIVENAVRHGIAPAARGGTVRITSRRDGPSLRLEVSDDGVGPGKSAQGSGVAIENTRRRLGLLYGDAGTVEMMPGADGLGWMVRITVPATGQTAVA